MKTTIRKYTPEADFLSPNRGDIVIESYALAVEDDVILCKVEDRSIRGPGRIRYSAYKLPDSFYVDPDDFECECGCEDEEDCVCKRPKDWEFNPNYRYPELGEYLGECEVVGDDD
jgi:hypothetical protein